MIMAAGKGTRMKSALPKVAHEVAGKPMVWWVAKACAAAGCERLVVVVGYEQDTVRACLDGFDLCDVVFVEQTEQLGTGHAVRMAEPAFESLISADASIDAAQTPVFVLAGDGPLIRSETLNTLLDRHRTTGAVSTLATAVLDNPAGYGRVLRNAAGGFEAIVEQKNATDEQLAICEVNPSYYCFEARALFRALDRVERNELTGEYYVTDVPALLLAEGGQVELVDAVPAEDTLSINTLEQLAEVDTVLRARLGAQEAGV